MAKSMIIVNLDVQEGRRIARNGARIMLKPTLVGGDMI